MSERRDMYPTKVELAIAWVIYTPVIWAHRIKRRFLR